MSSSPEAIPGSKALFWAALPPRFTAVPATQTEANSGLAVSVRPVSSVTTPSPLYPNARPPYSSGKGMPAQPSSTMAFQVARSKASGLSESRSLRSCAIGALVAQNSRALSLSMVCSSLRIMGMVAPPKC